MAERKLKRECLSCGDVVTASNEDLLYYRMVGHKKDCHPGFKVAEVGGE